MLQDQNQEEKVNGESKAEEVKVGEYVADNQIHTLKKSITCERSEHFFTYISGTEVECMKCHMGYGVNPAIELKNGHLYIHGEFLI